MALSEEHYLMLLKMKSELGEVVRKDGREVERQARKMDRDFDRVRRSMDGVARTAQGMFRAVTPGWRSMAAGILAVASAQQAAARSADFQTSMAEVATILPDAAGGVEILSKQVLGLAVAQNKLETDVAGGLYQTISAGFSDAGQALQVLEKSSVLATAGLASNQETVDLVTTSLNAYNEEAEEAGRVTDVWFTVVREGKTTIPELASSVGRVIPLAATLGIGIEELGAALATATANGQETSLAVTNQGSLYKSLLTRVSEVNAVFERSGETYDLNTLRTKGLSHVVRVLDRNTRDAAEAQEVLGGSVEALNGFLTISGGNFRSFQGDLNATTHSAGNASRALEKMQGPDAFKVGQTMRAIRVETIAFGDEINESLAKAVEGFGGVEAVQEAVRGGFATLNPLMERVVDLGASWLSQFREFAPEAEEATLKAEIFLIKAEKVARTLAGMVPGSDAYEDSQRAAPYVQDQLRQAIRTGSVPGGVLRAFPGVFDGTLARLEEVRAELERFEDLADGGGGPFKGTTFTPLHPDEHAEKQVALTEERARLEEIIEERARSALDASLKRSKELAALESERMKRQRDAEKELRELQRARFADLLRQQTISGVGLPNTAAAGEAFPKLGGLPVAAAGFDSGSLRDSVMSRGGFPTVMGIDFQEAQREWKKLSAAFATREGEEQRAAAKLAQHKQVQLDYSMQLAELQLRGATTDDERLSIAQRLHDLQREVMVSKAEGDGFSAQQIEQLARAFDNLKPKIGEVGDELDGLFGGLRDSIQRAASSNLGDFFVDFLSGAKSGKEAMRDFASSVLSDIGRILAQKAAISIIGSAGSNGIAGTGLFGAIFASGGIGPAGMGATRPLPIHAYSMGGVASHPQVGVFGEGRNREAFVPLPDNRTIPVTLKGDGGGSTTIQVNMPVSTTDAKSFEQGIEQRSAAVARAITRELRGNALLRGQVRRVASGRA